MNLTVTGTIISTDTQSGTSKSGNPWQKKMFTIEFLEGTFTKHLAFELFGEDKVKNNPFRKGQTVTVSFDISSQEWNGKWYTQLSAYRVEKFDPKNTTQNSSGNIETTPSNSPQFNTQPVEEELPF